MAKKTFKFPKSVLNQVEECSKGGYVLFAFNGDSSPCIHSHADDCTTALALQMQVINWGKAIEATTIEATINQMVDDSQDASGSAGDLGQE